MKLDPIQKKLFREKILAYLSLIFDTASTEAERVKIKTEIGKLVRVPIGRQKPPLGINEAAKHYITGLINGFYSIPFAWSELLQLISDLHCLDAEMTSPSLQPVKEQIAQARAHSSRRNQLVFLQCAVPNPEHYLADEEFKSKTKDAPTVQRYVRDRKIPGMFIMDEAMSSALMAELESTLAGAPDDAVSHFFQHAFDEGFFNIETENLRSLSTLDYKKVKSFLALFNVPLVRRIYSVLSRGNLFVRELYKIHENFSDQVVMNILNAYMSTPNAVTEKIGTVICRGAFSHIEQLKDDLELNMCLEMFVVLLNADFSQLKILAELTDISARPQKDAATSEKVNNLIGRCLAAILVKNDETGEAVDFKKYGPYKSYVLKHLDTLPAEEAHRAARQIFESAELSHLRSYFWTAQGALFSPSLNRGVMRDAVAFYVKHAKEEDADLSFQLAEQMAAAYLTDVVAPIKEGISSIGVSFRNDLRNLAFAISS